jgi:fukutin-related protein
MTYLSLSHTFIRYRAVCVIFLFKFILICLLIDDFYTFSIIFFQLQYSNESFHDGGKKLMTSYHSRSKRKSIKKDHFRQLYKKLQIKKVVKKFHYIPEQKHLKNGKKNREKGNKLNNEKTLKGNNAIKIGKEAKNLDIDVLIEQFEIPASYFANQSAQVQLRTDVNFFGCEKNTKSCIGQVYNEKPFYYYLNRHTPPCCLEKLKAVFQYIIEELENTGIRYWLDNFALRDAAESTELSHDAFEIDISFNVNDYNRSTSIKRCFDSRPFTDLSGFYWIKATDGHYLKIQYSKMNDIHVNLLPFEIQGDKMCPKGFYGSKAKSFSIEFLHPMATVFFLGRNVFTPNNVPNYLGMKGLN